MNAKTSDQPKLLLLDAWEKHENIAMHFNELILKIRIQALGALAAIVTVGGILVKTLPSESHIPWGLLAVVFLVLSLFWVAIWLLDFLYYNRLLRGAVHSILLLEDAINFGSDIDFNMSHKIEAAVFGEIPARAGKRIEWGRWLFYSIVAFVLITGAVCSTIKWLWP